MNLEDVLTMRTIRQLQYRYDLAVTESIHIQTQNSTFPICPKCAGALAREYMAYCDQCGQKLNWKGWRHVKAKTI